jgi:hypothetical protein
VEGLDKGFALGVETLLPRQDDGTLILLTVKWDGEAEGCQPSVTVHELLASDLPRNFLFGNRLLYSLFLEAHGSHNFYSRLSYQ